MFPGILGPNFGTLGGDTGGRYMRFSDITTEAWQSITGNKIRSILTVIGIVIGVMAVVIMVAVGETVQRQISNQFSQLGTNTIMIRAGAGHIGPIRSGNTQTLTIQDAEYIRQMPGVAAVTPVHASTARIVYGNQNWSTSVVGVYPDYASIQSIETVYGTSFDMFAVRNATTYAIIGPTTADELELPENPVGEIIRIQNTPFTIIGKTKPKGDSAFGSPDDMIIIPITTLKKRIQGSNFPNSVPMIAVKLYDTIDTTIAIEQISTVLRQRHKLKDNMDNDFQIMDMKQILETLNTVTWYMKMLLIAIAAISLLVGAIGIMNMMLVSVAERTREIGIRKAIGAQERDIVIQFLSESIMISGIGSFAGLCIGIIIAQGVGRGILHYDVPCSIWPPMLALSVAIIVGLASGAIPAYKAAKLNPIDSLRYE